MYRVSDHSPLNAMIESTRRAGNHVATALTESKTIGTAMTTLMAEFAASV
jgi:hypothetical protein